MNGDPPDKDKLLGELESIREFLTEEEAGTGPAESIPTLTLIAAEDEPLSEDETAETDSNFSANTEEAISTLSDEAAALHSAYAMEIQGAAPEMEQDIYEDVPSSEAETQIVVIDEAIANLEISEVDNHMNLTQESEAPQTEHDDRQTQMFAEVDDDILNEIDGAARLNPLPPAKPRKKPQKTSETPKRGAGENPFLPPHIRERLGRHKDLADQIRNESRAKIEQKNYSERVEVQGDLLAGFTKTDAGSDAAFTRSGEKIIDELVAEYLPRIEQRLREKLKAQLTSGKK